jgi:hypothetical protein
MVNSIEQPRVRSQASLHQVINTLKSAAKIFEIDYCCPLYPAGLALAMRGSPPFPFLVIAVPSLEFRGTYT